MTPDERLLYLARLVEQVPPRLLVMDEWFSNGEKDEGGRVTPLDTDCGTAACAIGWATRCPAFRDEGFGTGIKTGMIQYTDADGKWWYAWSAIVVYFGLDYHAANRLFLASAYTDPTPATVAARIRAFVAARTAKEVL